MISENKINMLLTLIIQRKISIDDIKNEEYKIEILKRLEKSETV